MELRVLPDLLLGLRKSFRKPELLKFRRSGGFLAISTDEFVERTLDLACGLQRLGIGRGDRVALLSENRPEWAASDFAILLLGAVTVPIYPTLPGNLCRFLLEDSGARIAIASTPDQLAKLVPLLERLASLEALIVMDPAAPPERPVYSWNGVATPEGDPSRRDPEAWRKDLPRPEDLASIIYTSGTTGNPKGVMLTHGNFCANIIGAARTIPIRKEDTILSFLPLSHVFERTTDYVGFYRGSTITYARMGEGLWEDFHAVRPTVVPTVPRFLEKIQAGVQAQLALEPPWKRAILRWAIATGRKMAAQGPGKDSPSPALRLRNRFARRLVLDALRERILGPRFRFFISGGAPLSLDVALFFSACGAPVLQGYGLTETSPVITLNDLETNRPGTVGRPIPGVEVRIAEDGEVLTRGPHLMKGYYRNPAATREVLRDGWLATGDIGRLDSDGFLTITDRKKDIIKTSGGKLVAPQPLEGRLREDDLISEAVLLGDGRRFISALIVPDFDRLERVAAEEGLPPQKPPQLVKHPRVIALFRERISRRLEGCAPYETVKRFRLLEKPLTIEEGELTPTQKVRRTRVEERYRTEIEEMYR